MDDPELIALPRASGRTRWTGRRPHPLPGRCP